MCLPESAATTFLFFAAPTSGGAPSTIHHRYSFCRCRLQLSLTAADIVFFTLYEEGGSRRLRMTGEGATCHLQTNSGLDGIYPCYGCDSPPPRLQRAGGGCSTLATKEALIGTEIFQTRNCWGARTELTKHLVIAGCSAHSERVATPDQHGYVSP